MKSVTLPSGENVVAFGLGTWRMGEDPDVRNEELATLRCGLESGANLIDTAEMYGDGQAEQLAGEAMKGRRDQVFLVDKVLPSNASHRGTISACERSLRRLKTDWIDLYLLHWRGEVPFTETIAAFRELQQADKIRYYGVSNLDLNDMQELWQVSGGQEIQTNQLLYNLSRRNIEWDLLPWLRDRRVPVMAYSPIEQARLLHDRRVIEFGQLNGMTPAQVCLSWLLAKQDIIVIPKTSSRQRLHENIAASQHPLSAAQLAELNKMFPPPGGPHSLEML